MSTQVIPSLQSAIDGLLYPSESDEPFEIVHWPEHGKPLDADELFKRTSQPPGTPVSVISLDEFFKDLTTEQRWFGDQEKATAQRYRDLEATLRRELTEIQVFRVGEVHVAIYIIGLTPQGDWAGLKTFATET